MYQKPELLFAGKLHDGANATGNGEILPVHQANTVSVQIEGISGDTITFEGSVDHDPETGLGTWYSVNARNLTSGVEATTATADGIYAAAVTGLGYFRARISSYSAGTIIATAFVTTGDLASAGGASNSSINQSTDGTTNRVVSGKATVISVTPTLDTNAYGTGEVLFETTAIADAVRASGLGATLMGVTLIDKDDEGVAITLYFFDSDVALGPLNDNPNIADADAANCIGIVDIGTGDYDDLGGAKVAHVRGIALPMIPASGTSLYVAGVVTGTPTFTDPADIVLNFHFFQD